MVYEDQTSAEILARMLAASPPDLDKRQGSVTNDLLSPAAIEFMRAYVEMNYVLDEGFADTASGSFLDKRATEYGLTRKSALKSHGVVTFTGPSGAVIVAGTLVSTGGDTPIYFTTDEDATISGVSVSVEATAQVSGNAGNVGIGLITALLGDLVGVVTVTNADNFEGGVNEETDEALLIRYLERARRPATSGNANQYRQWALEIAGVSDAKVYPIWDGPGTVRVVLLDDERTSPDASIVNAAQTYIDPTMDGRGMGAAPIGAIATVEGATEVPINVSVDADIVPGSTLAEVEALLSEGTSAYLKTLAFADPLVRITRIASVILDIPPVIDYRNLTINGGVSNILIPDGSVAVLGTVTVI